MAGLCSSATDAGATGATHTGYQRRRPERSVLHQLVSQHIETLWAEAAAQSPHGSGYPAYVKHEFERFLGCGLLPGGFSRLRCRSCGAERLVAFSCKGRALCPSCVARRMADTASHLVDRVLPRAAYRQWTLTFPYALRLRLVRDPTLLGTVLSDFLRTVFAWQRLQARRAGLQRPATGAITMIQFWGSLLQLTPHFHAWLPDGVLCLQSDGTLAFERLASPDDRELERLLRRIARRVQRRFETLDELDDDDDDAPVAAAQADSLRIAAFTLGPTDDERRRPLCVTLDGFTLHAALSIPEHDRAALERALRYGLRPPLSAKRLQWAPGGKVRLLLRKPLSTGQTDLLFEPLPLLRRLAASIPKPRQNMVRFHGIFAPHAAKRSLLAPLLPKPAASAATPLRPADPVADTPSNATLAPALLPAAPTPVPVAYRRPWAELLRRIHDHDVLRCPRCDGRMVPVQTVKDPAVIAKVLAHLGLPTSLPAVAAARAPPQLVFDLDEPAELDRHDVVFDA